MRIAILSPIAWRTPPRQYGPWELVASTIAEGLVNKGHDVTLFATGDSITTGKLDAICPFPYEENREMDAKVWECLHISNLMEKASSFDLIHNHFDFLPLTYSKLIKTPLLTTIHGFSSEDIIPVYKKYNANSTYISISDADRHPQLDYTRTIYHGIDDSKFTFCGEKEEYLLFYGRIHQNKGTKEAIEIARLTGYTLIIAGLIQDKDYFDREVANKIDDSNVIYLGNVSQAEGNNLLRKAKGLLHPILFDEPFGLSVAEAMMCGTPVIAFSRGSMPELIEHGRTGYLVNTVAEAVDVISALKSIDPYYCRAHALEKFGTEKMINEYVEVYESLIFGPN